MQPPHVVILGATGFIGRALVLRLLGRGYRVTALARSPERALRTLPAGVSAIDFGEQRALRAGVAGADAVVNLAGASIAGRWTAARKRRIYDSRIDPTRRLVDAIAARAHQLPVFVSVSAAGWYGDRGEDVLDDRDPASDDFLATVCRHWEAAAALAEPYARRIVHARMGVVLGREGGVLAKLLPIYRLGLGGRLGGGAQWMPWVHIEDATAVLAEMIADARFNGPVDVTAPSPVRQRDFARALGEALGRPTLLPVPRFALRLALGEAATMLLASQRIVPRALHRIGYGYRFPELEAALADIVDDGVRFDRVTPAELPEAAYLRAREPRTTLRARTQLDAPLAEVFRFFASAENLAAITPPDLGLEIVTPRPIELAHGTLVDYKLRILGVPIRWQTQIERWQPGRSFVDVQLRGPYRAWWHEHRFAAEGPRTRMDDLVHYGVPLGALGAVLSSFVVRRMLRRIFGYRRQAIRMRFDRYHLEHAEAIVA